MLRRRENRRPRSNHLHDPGASQCLTAGDLESHRAGVEICLAGELSQPLSGGDRSDTAAIVLRELKSHYGLNPRQEQLSIDIADRYVQAGRDLLARFSGSSERPDDVEFRELQIQFEKEFLSVLTPEQFDAMRRRYPVLIGFQLGGNLTTDTEDNGGF